ncbi:hypothetical protein J6590_066581 [Homalodisca vitripennis]|nr:hypothetical protein J6590_066581 [Homalodisca vitripennis]
MAVDSEDDLCGECNLIIKNSDQVLICAGFCKYKFHSACRNIVGDKFQALQLLEDSVMWMCEQCIKKLTSIFSHVVNVDDYFNLHEMTRKLLVLVKGVISDNRLLNEIVNSIDVNFRLAHDGKNVVADDNLEDTQDACRFTIHANNTTSPKHMFKKKNNPKNYERKEMTRKQACALEENNDVVLKTDSEIPEIVENNSVVYLENIAEETAPDVSVLSASTDASCNKDREWTEVKNLKNERKKYIVLLLRAITQTSEAMVDEIMDALHQTFPIIDGNMTSNNNPNLVSKPNSTYKEKARLCCGQW